MLNQSQNSRGISESNTQIHAHAPTADSMISEVLNTLKSIDLQHDADSSSLRTAA
jgi:hypothetical protein